MAAQFLDAELYVSEGADRLAAYEPKWMGEKGEGTACRQPCFLVIIISCFFQVKWFWSSSDAIW